MGSPRRGAVGDGLDRGGGGPAAKGWCGLAWELHRKEGELFVKSVWTKWWWWRSARDELELAGVDGRQGCRSRIKGGLPLL